MDDSAGLIISGVVGTIAILAFDITPLLVFLEWYFGFHFFDNSYYWFYTPR